jgi:hypothetical protein
MVKVSRGTILHGICPGSISPSSGLFSSFPAGLPRTGQNIVSIKIQNKINFGLKIENRNSFLFYIAGCAVARLNRDAINSLVCL